MAEQAGLEEFAVGACEGGPSAAVAALAEMLLDERNVRHRDRFMVPIRLSQVPGVVADGAANPRQRAGEVSLLEIQISGTYVSGMPEIAFRQPTALQCSNEIFVCHGFSLRRWLARASKSSP